MVVTFQQALNKEVTIVENGVKKKMTVFEVIVKQLVQKAASGDIRASKELIRWIDQINLAEVRAMPPPSLIVNFIDPPLPGNMTNPRRINNAVYW